MFTAVPAKIPVEVAKKDIHGASKFSNQINYALDVRHRILGDRALTTKIYPGYMK